MKKNNLFFCLLIFSSLFICSKESKACNFGQPCMDIFFLNGIQSPDKVAPAKGDAVACDDRLDINSAMNVLAKYFFSMGVGFDLDKFLQTYSGKSFSDIGCTFRGKNDCDLTKPTAADAHFGPDVAQLQQLQNTYIAIWTPVRQYVLASLQGAMDADLQKKKDFLNKEIQTLTSAGKKRNVAEMSLQKIKNNHLEVQKILTKIDGINTYLTTQLSSAQSQPYSQAFLNIMVDQVKRLKTSWVAFSDQAQQVMQQYAHNAHPQEKAKK